MTLFIWASQIRAHLSYFISIFLTRLDSRFIFLATRESQKRDPIPSQPLYPSHDETKTLDRSLFSTKLEESSLFDKMLECKRVCFFDEKAIFIHLDHIAFTDQGPLIDLNDSEPYPISLLYFSPRRYCVEYHV